MNVPGPLVRIHDRWAQIVDQAIEQRIVLGGVFFSMFVVVGVLAFGIVETNRRAVDAADATRTAVRCVIEQIGKGRAAAVLHYADEAQAHGYGYVPPKVPIFVRHGKDPCADLLTSTQLAQLGIVVTTPPTTTAPRPPTVIVQIPPSPTAQATTTSTTARLRPRPTSTTSTTVGGGCPHGSLPLIGCTG